MKYCDYFCEYADFPNDQTYVGACRRVMAVYCHRLARLVPKNGPCQWEKTKENPTAESAEEASADLHNP